MPSTAWTIPSSVANSTTRSRTERTGSGTDSPLGRVERVSETVADEVDAENDQHERQTREDSQPPGLRVVLAVEDEHAEGGRGWLDAEPEEGEGRLDEDRLSDGQGAVDDDGPDRVWEHVAEHDAQVAGAGGLGRLHVFLLAQR